METLTPPITLKEVEKYIISKIRTKKDFSFSLTTKRRVSSITNTTVHVFQISHFYNIAIFWYYTIRYSIDAQTQTVMIITDKGTTVNKEVVFSLLKAENINKVDIRTAKELYKDRLQAIPNSSEVGVFEKAASKCREIFTSKFEALHKRYLKHKSWKNLLNLFLYITTSALSHKEYNQWKDIDNLIPNSMRSKFVPYTEQGVERISQEIRNLYICIRDTI
jgi:hypothetical protein